MSKFTIKLNGVKALSFVTGATAFLLAPCGLAGSLAVAAGVSALTAIGVYAKQQAEIIKPGEVIEVLDDTDTRTVVEHSVLVAGAAAVLALPIAGLIGLGLKVVLFGLFKQYFYSYIQINSKREPTFNRLSFYVAFLDNNKNLKYCYGI